MSLNRSCPTSCYSCLGRATSYIIKDTEHGRFHFDRRLRPLFVYTPHKHFEQVPEIPGDELVQMYKDIQEFMWTYMGTRDFQTMNNWGSWKTHKHFHIKIKCDEDAILKRRETHLGTQPYTDILSPRPMPQMLTPGHVKQLPRVAPRGPSYVLNQKRAPSPPWRSSLPAVSQLV